MRNLLTTLAIAALACSCTSKPTSYTVSGVVDSTLNGKTVYMFDFQSNKTTDSAVIAEAKFTFTGVADSAVIRRVGADRNHATLILENGTITVDFKNNSATGTAMNDSMTSYLTKLNSVYSRAQERYNAIKSDSTLDDVAKQAAYELNSDTVNAERKRIINPAFNANTNNALGAFVVWSGSIPAGLLEEHIAKAGDVIKNFRPIANEIKRMERLKSTAAGKMFVDLDLINSKGEAVKLSDYVGKGKYALLDFWASWCGPCRAEIPNLAKIHQNYGKDVEVIGINVWDLPKDAAKTISEMAMNWTILTDTTENTATNLYGISGIPQIILIAPDGTIVARDLRNDAIEAKIKEELAKK